MTDARKGELFRDVAAALQQAGHRMCVLRGYESYPERVGSDIDAVCDDPAQIPRILSEQNVASVVQASRYDASTYLYLLCRQHADGPVFLPLDVSADFRYRGHVFYDGEELLGARRPFKFFEVPPAELEFGAYLVNRITKRTSDEAKYRRLTELYEEDPVGCERQLARFFSRADTELIAFSVRSGEWGPMLGRIEHLRRGLLNEVGRERPLGVLLHRLGEPWRRLRPFLRPEGLMVAFLGVDGSGKSTVIDRVSQDLRPAFRDARLYHKRPFPSAPEWAKRYLLRLRPDERKDEKVGPILEEGGAPAHDPYALPPRKLAASLAKLGFIWANYTLSGYVADIYPRLVRSTLVLFDRYYHDLLVDAKRYRYGGPAWLARAVGRLFPRTQLVVLLDAPPEVLYSRKQEFSFEEIARQREGYLELAKNLPNGHVVDSSESLDEVVARVERIILGYMAKRAARRSRRGLEDVVVDVVGLGRARTNRFGARG